MGFFSSNKQEFVKYYGRVAAGQGRDCVALNR